MRDLSMRALTLPSPRGRGEGKIYRQFVGSLAEIHQHAAADGSFEYLVDFWTQLFK